MAFNTLSGSVLAPTYLGPASGTLGTNVLSGTLQGDGSTIEYVPRFSNATDNALVTNVGGDANSFTCESNLTFDGSTLTLTGDVTASVGMSASVFFGDGSQLTGISASGGSADPGGSSGSVQVNDGTNLTGSATLTYANRILVVSGGLTLNRRSVSTTITASSIDYYIGVDSSDGALEVRLLDASSLASGQTYVLKDEGGAANTNNITILPSGAQTIDGQTSAVLESPYAAIQIYCNGTNKYFIC